MIEIRYYPLIDCDTECTEKVAMIPTPNGSTIKTLSGMWLEEMIPHYFRLCTQNNDSPADSFHIRCPRCSKMLKQIAGDVDNTKRGLYICSSCAND